MVCVKFYLIPIEQKHFHTSDVAVIHWIQFVIQFTNQYSVVSLQKHFRNQSLHIAE